MRSEIEIAYSKDLIELNKIIESPPLGVHSFIANLEKSFCFLSIDAIKKKLKKTIVSLPDRKGGLITKKPIPRIMHRVWLNSKKSVIPEEKYLATIKATCQNLGKDWQHIIWVNNSETKKTLDSYYKNIKNLKVVDIRYDFSPLMLGDNIDKLIQDGKLAFACDQLRLELIYQYGGLYGDVGFHFKHNISDIIFDCDYMFILGHGLFFQNSFFGSNPQDPLFRLLLEVNKNPNLFPRELLGKIDSSTEGYLASGLMLTYLYLITVPDNVKPIVFCGNKEIVQWGSQRTWYDASSSEKSGSSIIKEAPTSLIDDDSLSSHCILNIT